MNASLPFTPVPFADFASRLLTLYEPPIRARATYARMAQLMEMLGKFPGVLTTADLTTPLFALWIASRVEQVCHNTVIGELGYLQTACEFGLEEGCMGSNPFRSRRLRIRSQPAARKLHHSLAEVARVLAYLRGRSETSWPAHRLYALASTIAYTGVRRNEGIFLRTEDVHLGDRVITIRPRAGSRLKTVASAAPVPVAEELAGVLEAWVPESQSVWLFPTISRESPWTGGNPGTKPLDRLKQAGLACGVGGLTWQSLRHSWATHAETAWGLSDPAIQRVLRHTSPMTSKLYRHADLPNLRAMVGAVSYREPFDGPPCPAD